MKKLLQLSFLLLTYITYSQQLEFEVFNTSINSKYAELGVSFLGTNNVVFASSKKTENDKSFSADRRKTNKQLYVDLYIASINNNTGDLVDQKKFTAEINNKFYVSDVTFSSDLKTTFFTWNNFYNTTSRLDSAKWQKLHIVKADINPNFEITNETELPFNSEEYTIKSPELSKDGKRLYFVSDMPNGYGNSDIYVVDINNDGTYSEPRNLGPKINSPDVEEFPHIDENNTLYFSSYGHNSKGGFDIFRSKFKDGAYQKVEQLPEPINTKYDDFAFVINTSSNTGYFTSTRKGGLGDADIYGFSMIEKEIECTQLISGIIINEETKKPISDVIISIFENDELINTLTTNKTGNYSFELKCSSAYKITTEKEHFTALEIDFTTDETFAFEISQNIELPPIPCIQLINGVVSDKLTNNLLENISVTLYENGKIISLKNTASDGSYTFSLKCNTNYNLIADKDGYNPTEIKINTSGIYDAELAKNIELIPLECNQLLAGTITNKLTGEQLINANFKLYLNNNLVKTTKLSSDGLFRFELSCNETYKIIAEKDGFINSEIELNTSNDRDLNINTNIELSPIICNQLISGVVTNKTTNEPLTQVTLNLFENNNLIDTQLVDSTNNYNFKVDCNSTYKIVAEKDGFLNSEFELKTDTRNDFNQVKNIELIPLECNQLLAGTITNKLTGEQLINANFNLYLNNNLVKTTKLSSDGLFRFELSCNETYKIIAEKDGFINSEIELNTSNDRDLNSNTNIELSPIICNQLISGVVTNKTTNEPLTQVTLNLFENNNLIDTQLVDSTNNYNFKVDCNSTYKIVAEKDGFVSSEFELKTDTRNDFNQVKNISLNPVKCVQTITGVIIDENTKERLNNVDISLFENNVLKETITLRNFEFQFNIDCNKTYRIVVDKTNYLSSELNFLTDSILNFSISKSIIISPLPCVQQISGNVLDIVTKIPISNAIVSIYSNDVQLESLKLDKNGFFKMDLDCKIPHQLVISATNYKINKWDINATNNYNESFSKTIFLNPEEEFEIVRKIKMLKTNSIDFDLDKSEITPLTALELEKVVGILIKHPTLKIEIKSHTDSRAPDSYNLSLSQKRAESIVNYIVSRGIDVSRLTAKGMGESELLNNCKNGEKCTEIEHLLNRRTEFIIIKQ